MVQDSLICPKIKEWKLSWSCCLGPVIYLSPTATETDLRHELGHYQQWRRLWLLYYIVVGIPSIWRWLMVFCGWRTTAWYYSGWPESDADKRGGIDREEGASNE